MLLFVILSYHFVGSMSAGVLSESAMNNREDANTDVCEISGNLPGPIDLDEYSVVIASMSTRARANKYLQDLRRRTRFSGRIVVFNDDGVIRYRVIAYTTDYHSDAEEVRDELREIYHSAWIYTKSDYSASKGSGYSQQGQKRSPVQNTTKSISRPKNSISTTRNSPSTKEERIKEIKSWICGKWYVDIDVFGQYARAYLYITENKLVFSSDRFGVMYSGPYKINLENNHIEYDFRYGTSTYTIIDEPNRRLKSDPNTPMTKYE